MGSGMGVESDVKERKRETKSLVGDSSASK